MFDFEKLDIYHYSKKLNYTLRSLISKTNTDLTTKNQLTRASLSVILNIAEGSGRRTKADKRHFYVISRGSLFECVAGIDTLKFEHKITESDFRNYYTNAEKLSRMLYNII